MVRLTFWLQLPLLVLILKQSDAAGYQSGEMREEIDRSEEDTTNTTELKHNNGEQADNCCACQSLLEAARSGEVNKVKNLLKCCNDNCTDRDNTTPLMWAAAIGNVEVVQVLLEDGANAETVNARRWTALNAAAKKGNLEVCRLLLDSGATVDTRNILGDTPLHGAAEAGHLSVVKLLVERGADVSVKNNAGMTPMHGAAWWEYLTVVKLLVEKGADVNVKNDEGSTPLQYAAMNGDLRTVKLLVESGADIRLKYKPGLTASDWARAQGNEDVAEWLDSVQESMSDDVDKEASNSTATDCLTTSVPSLNQTDIAESGQQQGVQTAAVDPTEKLDLVSREVERECGAEEVACRSLLEAARSGGVDRAKDLAMCDSSDNCTDGSFFPVTPQTDGPHVDIASNSSRLSDQLTEVNVSRNSTVTKGPAVMTNDYDQTAKNFEEKIAKEFEEQTMNKFADKMAKEFQDQTAKDDVWRKVLGDETASYVGRRKALEDKTASDDVRRKVLGDETASDVWRKVLEDKTASYNWRRKALEDQTASDDVRRKVLGDETASDVWRRVLEDVKKLKVNENLPKMLEGNKTLASILH